MAVRSKRLVYARYTGGDVLAYTTPAGKTALIKTLTFYNHSGGVSVCHVGMRVGPVTLTLIGLSLPANSGAQFNLSHVLHPGDSITIGGVLGGVQVDVIVSGAELLGVA